MSLDLARVKAICFDVDGTLSDTDDQFVRKLIRILSPLGIMIRQRNVDLLARKAVMLTEGPGNWFYSLADRIGWDGKIVALGDKLYELGIGNNPQPFLLMHGVREMLVTLHRFYPLSIVSARGHKSTFRFLVQFELASFFNAVATGQTVEHTKPYPDPIEWAAVRMGVAPSDCLMVGDTAIDILTGKKAGAQTVGVLCGFGEEKELIKAGADLILRHTADLSRLITRSW